MRFLQSPLRLLMPGGVLVATLIVYQTWSSPAPAEPPETTPRSGSLPIQKGPGPTSGHTLAGTDIPQIDLQVDLYEDQPRLPIGVRIDQLSFRDVSGQEYHLADLKKQGPVVLVTLSSKCPLVLRYTQRLHRLHKQFSKEGVSLFGLYTNAEETSQSIQEHNERTAWPFPVIHDLGGHLANRLGATITPQAFLLDRLGELRYRGGLDDNRNATRVKRHFLREAIESVLAGRPVAHPEGRSLGCSIHLDKPGQVGGVTYTKHIARLLNQHCRSCHRPGEVGPFPLTNYDQARRWAKEIQAYTQARLMPPWKAAPEFGRFRNDRSLSADELRLIELWVQQGTPRGEAEHLPPQPKFPTGWALGEPDLVVEMPEEYKVAPEGEDDYRHFIIPTDFAEDRYVEAIDVRPGNRQTVHHVIVYTDTSGKARQLDAVDPEPGYSRFGGVGFKAASALGGWAPGATPGVLPQGTGRWLPQGADIVMQVHYYRTGVWERDRTQVALYFSKSPQPKRVTSKAVINKDFVVPPGSANYQVTAQWVVKRDVYALSVFPHMHLLGQDMRVWAENPAVWDQPQPLIWLKNWDFNWQMGYDFHQPLLLPKGTKVKLVAHFDNSEKNPNNPNSPPKAVGWGERTTDEMCIAFISQVPADQWQPPTGNSED